MEAIIAALLAIGYWMLYSYLKFNKAFNRQ
jgi:hypothetical protein